MKKPKTASSGRRHPAASRRRPKARLARRTHAPRKKEAAEDRPALEEEKPYLAEAPSAFLEPDKRDDELSDEESLDREEKHALY